MIGEQADLRRSWQVRVSFHRDRLVGVVCAEVLVHLNKLGSCQNLAIILLIINLIRLKSIFHSRVIIQPALRALGLFLADGAPTVGGGKTF